VLLHFTETPNISWNPSWILGVDLAKARHEAQLAQQAQKQAQQTKLEERLHTQRLKTKNELLASVDQWINKIQAWRAQTERLASSEQLVAQFQSQHQETTQLLAKFQKDLDQSKKELATITVSATFHAAGGEVKLPQAPSIPAFQEKKLEDEKYIMFNSDENMLQYNTSKLPWNPEKAINWGANFHEWKAMTNADSLIETRTMDKLLPALANIQFDLEAALWQLICSEAWDVFRVLHGASSSSSSAGPTAPLAPPTTPLPSPNLQTVVVQHRPIPSPPPPPKAPPAAQAAAPTPAPPSPSTSSSSAAAAAGALTTSLASKLLLQNGAPRQEKESVPKPTTSISMSSAAPPPASSAQAIKIIPLPNPGKRPSYEPRWRETFLLLRTCCGPIRTRRCDTCEKHWTDFVDLCVTSGLTEATRIFKEKTASTPPQDKKKDDSATKKRRAISPINNNGSTTTTTTKKAKVSQIYRPLISMAYGFESNNQLEDQSLLLSDRKLSKQAQLEKLILP